VILGVALDPALVERADRHDWLRVSWEFSLRGGFVGR
jgi:hypothetical protein